MAYLKFSGIAVVGGQEINGFGCYTDENTKQYIINEDRGERTFTQVIQVKLEESDE